MTLLGFLHNNTTINLIHTHFLLKKSFAKIINLNSEIPSYICVVNFSWRLQCKTKQNKTKNSWVWLSLFFLLNNVIIHYFKNFKFFSVVKFKIYYEFIYFYSSKSNLISKLTLIVFFNYRWYLSFYFSSFAIIIYLHAYFILILFCLLSILIQNLFTRFINLYIKNKIQWW